MQINPSSALSDDTVDLLNAQSESLNNLIDAIIQYQFHWHELENEGTFNPEAITDYLEKQLKEKLELLQTITDIVVEMDM